MFSKIFSNSKSTWGFIGICLFTLSSLLIPLLVSFDANNIDLNNATHPPSMTHFLGTDRLGRDLLLRIFIGLRISLLLAFISSIVAVFLGTLIGGLCGLVRGKLDFIFMKIIDLLNSLPLIFIIIIIAMMTNRELNYLIVCLSLITWPNLARIIRDRVVEISTLDYFHAAKSLGETHVGLLKNHILPNIKSAIYLNFMLSIPNIIVNETFLSFLGLGLRPPMSSIGNMLSHSINELSTHSYMAYAPISSLIFMLLFFHLFVEGLKDSINNE